MMKIQEIQATALRLVADHGLEGLSLHRVAKELDCVVGALYRYFDSKDALLTSLQVEVIERWATGVQRAADKHEQALGSKRVDASAAALSSLFVIIESYRRFPSQDPAGFQLLSAVLGDPRPILAPEHAAPVIAASQGVVQRVVQTLDRARQHEALNPGSSSARAFALWSALHGALCMVKLTRFSTLGVDGNQAVELAVDAQLMGWGASAAGVRAARKRAGRTLDELQEEMKRPKDCTEGVGS